MAKGKDARRFGPGPYLVGLQRLDDRDTFPFGVPAVAQVEQLRFDQPVTVLAGENGSSKSTILEAAAAAIGFTEQGGELSRLGDLPAVPRDVLDENRVPLLAPVLSTTKPRNGYFLRAESFFNVAEFIDGGDRFAPDLSLYGDVPLHAQSHGESFLAPARERESPASQIMYAKLRIRHGASSDPRHLLATASADFPRRANGIGHAGSGLRRPCRAGGGPAAARVASTRSNPRIRR